MSMSSGSSGRGMDNSREILVKEIPEIEGDDFTEEQLALIEETLDLVMLKKFGHTLDELDGEESEDFPEFLLNFPEELNFPSRENSKITNVSSSISSVSSEKTENLILGVTEVQEKICRCLFDIQSHIQSDVAFEDDELVDEQRRRRRFEEFSTRLSRNYIYQVSCLTAEIQSTNRKRLLSKTSQLFTAIFHALRFYCQNMVNFTNEMQLKKLIEMIEIVYNGLRVCLKKRIFAEEDELVGRMRKMLMEIFSDCDQVCENSAKLKATPKKTPTKKTASNRRRSVPKNPLAMYLPQQPMPKKATTPTFHLNLEGSDDEAPEGISRELSTEHLDTVTTEDRLKLMEEQPRPTTSNSRPRTHPSVSILEPNRDDFRHKSRELHRKDRASSHASSSMKATEGQDKLMSFAQKRNSKKGKRSSLDSAYSEIGKEIVEMVGEDSIKSIVLVNILRNSRKENKSQNGGKTFTKVMN